MAHPAQVILASLRFPPLSVYQEKRLKNFHTGRMARALSIVALHRDDMFITAPDVAANDEDGFLTDANETGNIYSYHTGQLSMMLGSLAQHKAIIHDAASSVREVLNEQLPADNRLSTISNEGRQLAISHQLYSRTEYMERIMLHSFNAASEATVVRVRLEQIQAAIRELDRLVSARIHDSKVALQEAKKLHYHAGLLVEASLPISLGYLPSQTAEEGEEDMDAPQ